MGLHAQRLRREAVRERVEHGVDAHRQPGAHEVPPVVRAHGGVPPADLAQRAEERADALAQQAEPPELRLLEVRVNAGEDAHRVRGTEDPAARRACVGRRHGKKLEPY